MRPPKGRATEGSHHGSATSGAMGGRRVIAVKAQRVLGKLERGGASLVEPEPRGRFSSCGR